MLRLAVESHEEESPCSESHVPSWHYSCSASPLRTLKPQLSSIFGRFSSPSAMRRFAPRMTMALFRCSRCNAPGGRTAIWSHFGDGRLPRTGDARNAGGCWAGDRSRFSSVARRIHDRFRRLGHLLLCLPAAANWLARVADDLGHTFSSSRSVGWAGHCTGHRRVVDDSSRHGNSVASSGRAAYRDRQAALGDDFWRRSDSNNCILLGLAAHLGRRLLIPSVGPCSRLERRSASSDSAMHSGDPASLTPLR